jgi:hypothetical protein
MNRTTHTVVNSDQTSIAGFTAKLAQVRQTIVTNWILGPKNRRNPIPQAERIHPQTNW